MSIGYMTGVMALLLVASSASSTTITDEQRLKDADGRTMAILITCNECQPGKKPKAGLACVAGTADGYWDEAPCGQCLIKANYGARISYPFDVVITGYLKDADGKPLPDQFVQLSMPNGWKVLSRTMPDGRFNLVLGATETRRSKTPLTKDLGTVIYKKASGKEHAYNLFMLPETFKSCPPPKAQKKAPQKPSKQ